ncbi:MAG: MFS transporter [Nitrospira sp.]|nr:MFS transporter [Nitrospira sp.]MBH0181005.1 MFS transporter [Nitrospira sp.]MBH0187054.1 MFS transporter [Nitrospira sp.]
MSESTSSTHLNSSAPPRTRWLILGLLFAISVVTYIDRVNISVTARQMMPALGLTDQQMGLIFSAFVIGYALFQVPGGWLADRWGIRIVLTIALLWWSGFTALTAMAAASDLAGLLGIVGVLALTRFLLGVGEATALPSFNRAVTDWLPAHERGLGIGIAIGGIGIGSAITPPVTAWIMVNYGWQTTFFVSAALGIGLAAIWWLLARDRPSDHPWVAKHETVASVVHVSIKPPSIPWAALRRTPTVWWLVLSYSCLGYVAYVYMSWFYLYLVNVRGFDVLQGGFYASVPFLAMLVSCPLGGWVTDRLALRRGITQGRKLVGMAGMTLAAATIALGALMESPYLAIASLSLGAGWLYFTIGAYWSSTSDLSKAHAGSLSGLMNMGANIGGAISPTLTPWIAQHWGWPASLGVAALIALIGGILWININPGKGLEREP